MSPTNKELFIKAYTVNLTVALKKNPNKFFYGPEAIPDAVRRMVVGLSSGNALMSATVRETAKELGVKPTLSAIKAFLNNTP